MTRFQLKRDVSQAKQTSGDPMLGTPLLTLGLSTAYAVALSYLERRLPIKPDHTWAEVAGGVLITLVPVAIAARRQPDMDWRQYEAAVWRGFIASGTPIILWQIGEAMVRQIELLRYAATREQAPVELMPTIPRRWPIEAESEREAAIQAADEAVQILQRAQTTLDSARARVHGNQSLTLVLVTDTERYVLDALTRADRVARFLSMARAKPIHGRWPMVASKQHEDAETALYQASDFLDTMEQVLRPVRDKVNTNPALSEAIIADAALLLARALNRLERVVRLLTEAGIGRD